MTYHVTVSLAGEIEDSYLQESCGEKFFEWINGKMSGSILAIWIAHQFAKSFKGEKDEPGVSSRSVSDLVAGGICRTISISKTLHERRFSKPVPVVVEEAFAAFELPVPTNSVHFESSKINSKFRRQVLNSRWNATVSDPATSLEGDYNALNTHISLEISRALLRKLSAVSRTKPVPPKLITDAIILAETGIKRANVPVSLEGLPLDHLNVMNVRVENYLISLMQLKSDFLSVLARLHDTNVYSVLGLDPSVSDAEVKRAYKNLAMQLHPDKGGDTELFQQLTDAYEKILEKRGLNKKNITESYEGTQEGREPASVNQTPGSRENVATDSTAKAEQDPDPRVISPIMKLIHSADDCVRQARTVSEITSRVAQLVKQGAVLEVDDDPDLRTLIVLTIKAIRIGGYSCLELSSLALDVVRDSPEISQPDTIAVVTSLASDAMNSGFDSLKSGADFGSVRTSPQLLELMTIAATKAVACAQVATKLVGAVERLTKSEPPVQKVTENDLYPPSSGPDASPLTAALELRLSNRLVLKRLNCDLLELQSQIKSEASSEDLFDPEWITTLIRDITEDACRKTERMFEASIIIRSPEQVADVFKSVHVLCNLYEDLAVSTDPTNRLMRFILNMRPDMVVRIVTDIALPRLVSLGTRRNRFTSPTAASFVIHQSLGLEKLSDRGKFFRKRQPRDSSSPSAIAGIAN